MLEILFSQGLLSDGTAIAVKQLSSKSKQGNRESLQQNVFLVTKISEELFFVTKNTALVTKYEFHH